MNPAQQTISLADIHLAEPVGSWPPAMGWWLFSALALIGLIGLVIWLYRRHHQKRFARKACRYLEQQAEPLNLQALNELLKITAMHYCRDPKLAGLSGNRWHQWLLNHCSAKQVETMTGLTKALQQHQYSAQEPGFEQRVQLQQATKKWLSNAWRISPSQEVQR